MLWGDLLEADNGVAKSDGSDVRGTWLQLVCCTLPKMSVSLIYLRGSRTENVRGGWSFVRGVILESNKGRLSGVIVRMKANED